MADYVIVTIKQGKRKDHDPHNKQTGPCPAAPDGLKAQCTDVTGEHHSFLMSRDGMTIEDIKLDLESEGMHVTRIEEVES